jgi:hypothetical protein
MRIRQRHSGEQCSRIGMQRLAVELLGAAELGKVAEIHHRDAVADVLDDREVVRDEQIGEPELLLQIHHQVDDLGLDRHVERRDRLVRDEEPRVGRERARDADALTLTARELVRVAEHLLAGQADLLEQPGDLLVTIVARELWLMHPKRLGDDVADRPARVE